MRKLLFLISSVICLTSCQQVEKLKHLIGSKRVTVETVAPKQQAITVKVMEINSEQFSNVKTYVGLAKASKSTLISATASGTIKTLSVKEGAKVSKGQTLAIIESPNVKSAYDIAKSSLEQAKDGYARAKKVYSTGSITEVQMKEITTKLNQAKATAAAAKNALEKCTITAPYSAYIEQINLNEGEQVEMFSPIMKLVDCTEIQIDFSVPENEISKIIEGDLVSIDVPAAEIYGATATITNKGVSASLLAHSYNCSSLVTKQYDNLLPGMVCKVYVNFQTLSAVLVPPDVVGVDALGRYVWVVEGDLAQKRRVTVSGFSGSDVIITDGLSKGDLLVTQGYQKISSGMKVSIQK